MSGKSDVHPHSREFAPNELGIEGALLWSVRAWVMDCTGPSFVASGDRITRLWSNLGIPVIAEYIDGMMWALAHGRRRSLRIHFLSRPEISADEAALLGAVARSRASQDDAVILRLSAMVMPGAAAAICDVAYRVRRTLDAAGHILPQNEATLFERAALGISLPTGSAPPYLH